MTYKAQSEPIVFRLPQQDPYFTIELYGQDLIFDPPILQFSRSSEASFRVTGASLGLKTMTMCRSGPNAIKYSGLPLSHSIVVERAFMKNTFQIAFVNPTGNKRRYMFSVDDPIIRNEWATCLRRQIDSSNATTAALKSAGSFASSKFHRAAQTIAFEILQEKLVGCRATGQSHSDDSFQNGNMLHHLTGSPTTFNITRSKSRSRVYHLHGAGKAELELNRLQNVSRESDYSSNINTPEKRMDGPLWTSRDLELCCQQNSSISLVLSFLQVGAPKVAAS
jgi:serine/arginine repetitive matrix protein 2